MPHLAISGDTTTLAAPVPPPPAAATSDASAVGPPLPCSRRDSTRARVVEEEDAVPEKDWMCPAPATTSADEDDDNEDDDGGRGASLDSEATQHSSAPGWVYARRAGTRGDVATWALQTGSRASTASSDHSSRLNSPSTSLLVCVSDCTGTPSTDVRDEVPAPLLSAGPTLSALAPAPERTPSWGLPCCEKSCTSA